MYKLLVRDSFRGATNAKGIASSHKIFNSRGGSGASDTPLPNPPANLDSLKLINQLRQLCNHPCLVKNQQALVTAAEPKFVLSLSIARGRHDGKLPTHFPI